MDENVNVTLPRGGESVNSLMRRWGRRRETTALEENKHERLHTVCAMIVTKTRPQESGRT